MTPCLAPGAAARRSGGVAALLCCLLVFASCGESGSDGDSGAQADSGSTDDAATSDGAADTGATGGEDGGAADAVQADAPGAGDTGAGDTDEADVGTADTGVTDTVKSDTGTTDAGATDAGTTDTGKTDAGTPDSGTSDAGTPDVGAGDTSAPDAAQPDATPTDTGPPPCQTSADCPQPKAGCEANLCVAGVCTAKTLPDGAPCTDANPCTTKATCQSGACKAAQSLDCDDGNPCTTDLCGAKGTCVHSPGNAGKACDDGQPCTSGTVCDAKGSCSGGSNSCACKSIKDCAAADDGDPCNGTLYCNLALKAPRCEVLPGTVVTCDTSGDGPCEQSACNPKTGACEVSPVAPGKPCDDGNPCTAGDHCSQGSCQAASNSCGCQITADCAAKEDGDPCNGTLYCDKAASACVVNPATVVSCKESADPCQVNACDPKTGGCKLGPVADGVPCDDGDAKTVGDVCSKGLCAGTSVAQCKGDADCAPLEDGDFCNGVLFCNQQTGTCQVNPSTTVSCPGGKDTACTKNLCQPATGLCKLTPAKAGTSCDDGDSCTVGETCQQGACTPSAYVCQCKSDSDCKAKEDGDACNGTLFCNQQSGSCEINPATVVSCPSAGDTACVKNTCAPKTGTCSPQPAKDGAACDDDDPCTSGEVCAKGQCQGTQTCGCKSDQDCVGQDDGDLCNGTLFCNKAVGKCQPNPATKKVCPTAGDTACAKNVCVPATGKCEMKPAFNGASCDADGNPCTQNDYCDSGVCKAGASVCGCYTDADCSGKQGADKCVTAMFCDKTSYTCKPAKTVQCDTSKDTACSKTACDPATGKCAISAQPAGTICGESAVCAGAQVCDDKGACVAGEASDCDDADPCTADSCDAKAGCQYSAKDSGPCDDGNVCTTADGCKAGQCVGTAKDCSDGSPCTDDACDPEKGCVHLPSKATVCDDGDACSLGDFCLQGLCLAGSKVLQCDDGNPCTKDSCDKLQGCVAKAVDGGKCDDGDGCTKKDACVGGSCKGVQLSCDDGSGCTKDSCDPDEGCVHLALTATPCDDGNACTVGDKCINSGLCASGKAKVCDDANPCTSDLCDPTQGCVFSATSASKCDDGNACTVNDKCTKAKCVGSPRDCDDGLICSKDTCDADAGCQHKVTVGSKCDDGNACTAGDTCTKSGACAPGVGLNCDDGNGCTTDACEAVAGCTHKLLDGIGCDDGDSCTTADKCSKGKCVGNGKSCDDGLACTKDGCDQAGGCVHSVAKDASCSDNNACTNGDSCLASGYCKPGAQVNCDDGNACTTDACLPKKGCEHTVKTGAACDDGTACTSGDGCNAKGVCAGSPISCDDGKDCTVDSCDKLKGCGHTMQTGKACSDGDACTVGDACLSSGACAPGKPKVCQDGLACTLDSCDKAKGCVFAATDGKGCDDGSACTKGDACKGTTCVGSPVSCDDGLPCTKDSCDKDKGCVHTVLAGSSCSDGNACTAGDTCSKAGTCTPGNPKVCDDGEVCTKDSCDPADKAGNGGCVNESREKVGCDDGDACTSGDACASGKCKGSPTGCDDGNPCTKDSCDKLKGCVNAAQVGLGCSDGNACTTGDKCNSLGLCAPAAVANCDDSNPCTNDGCAPSSGCTNAKLDGAACDDGDACTTGDKCDKGVCKTSPRSCDDGNACTADSCDKLAGCKHTVKTGQSCSDGDACTAGDVCAASGVCTPKSAVNCDDKEPCTVDTCDKSAGCKNLKQTGVKCDDGDACTTDDACVSGKCTAKPLSCADGNPCTTEKCDKATGCQVTQLDGVKCDDNNACTKDETCTKGTCKAGSAVDCDDKNECTSDLCDTAAGCKSTALTGKPCNDGDACTKSDLCQAGACKGTAAGCDDGNACTIDSCDKLKGCQYTIQQGKTCDDGNACTEADACTSKGTCAGKDKKCDDSNTCTLDSCDKVSGCVFTKLQGAACDDGKVCTDNDACSNGVCAGLTKSCDDNNDCTNDSCHTKKGCLNAVQKGKACNDGDECTSGDACGSLGKCAGTKTNCSDGNDCTTDACNKFLGCFHKNTAANSQCSDGDGCTVDWCDGTGSCRTKSALWAYALPQNYKAYDMVVDADGSVVVVGQTATTSTGGFFLRVQNAGKQLDPVPNTQVHRYRKVVKRPGGGYIAVGDDANTNPYYADYDNVGTARMSRLGVNGKELKALTWTGANYVPNRWTHLAVGKTYAAAVNHRSFRFGALGGVYVSVVNASTLTQTTLKRWTPSGADQYTQYQVHGVHILDNGTAWVLATASLPLYTKTWAVKVTPSGSVSAEEMWSTEKANSHAGHAKYDRVVPVPEDGSFWVHLGKSGKTRRHYDKNGKLIGVNVLPTSVPVSVATNAAIRGDQLVVTDGLKRLGVFNHTQLTLHHKTTMESVATLMRVGPDRNVVTLVAPPELPAPQQWSVQRRDPWGNALCTDCFTKHGKTGCATNSAVKDTCDVTNGQCTGTLTSSLCNDGNPCTNDTVGTSGCAHTPKTGQSCSLISGPCMLSTTGTCSSAGVCSASQSRRVCSYSNPCRPAMCDDYADNAFGACTPWSRFTGTYCGSGKSCRVIGSSSYCYSDTSFGTVYQTSSAKQSIGLSGQGARKVVATFGSPAKYFRSMRVYFKQVKGVWPYRLILKTSAGERTIFTSTTTCGFPYRTNCLPRPSNAYTMRFPDSNYPTKPGFLGGTTPSWIDDRVNTKFGTVWQLIVERTQSCTTSYCPFGNMEAHAYVRYTMQ